MTLNDEQLQQVKEMAEALLPAEEIAVLLGLNDADRRLFAEMCRNHTNSPVYLTYQKGLLQTKYELRKTIIKLAKAGSPAAEPIAEKYIREHKL